MTATEKRYGKHIGKLYWCGQRTYNSDLNGNGYHYYYNLIMVRAIEKDKYSKKYQYVIDVLSSPYNHGQTYRVECSYFLTLVGPINKYGNGYLPATTGDLEKDVAQIQKAC